MKHKLAVNRLAGKSEALKHDIIPLFGDSQQMWKEIVIFHRSPTCERFEYWMPSRFRFGTNEQKKPFWKISSSISVTLIRRKLGHICFQFKKSYHWINEQTFISFLFEETLRVEMKVCGQKHDTATNASSWKPNWFNALEQFSSSIYVGCEARLTLILSVTVRDADCWARWKERRQVNSMPFECAV